MLQLQKYFMKHRGILLNNWEVVKKFKLFFNELWNKLPINEQQTNPKPKTVFKSNKSLFMFSFNIL